MAIDWLKLFRSEPKSSAQTAKERLMVAVAYQRAGRDNGPIYLQRMREEILEVVRRYVQVPDQAVQFSVQREDGIEVLELNITLPEEQAAKS